MDQIESDQMKFTRFKPRVNPACGVFFSSPSSCGASGGTTVLAYNVHEPYKMNSLITLK